MASCAPVPGRPAGSHAGVGVTDAEAFTASVSHDLQAPLRQIQGFVALLVREIGGSLGPAARQHLDDIADAARHMADLVDTLLDYSRAGCADLHVDVVDLDALAAEIVCDAVRAAGPERRIRWSTAPLPPVTGDRALLRQALVNLIDNAVKYTRTRPVAEITIGIAPAPAGSVCVFVRDNGVGFDMKHAHRLFDPFRRLHPASEFEGTGVGLASVRRIVARHGGRVWASSAVGQGATFWLTLPAAPASRGPAGVADEDRP